MNREWQRDLAIHAPPAAASLPPAMVEETGWDILLALYADERGEMGLGRLASIVSVHRAVLGNWLGWLEERRLVSGERGTLDGDLRAILTRDGRELLDRYLSAVGSLQLGAGH